MAKWRRAFKDWLYWEDRRGEREGGRPRLGGSLARLDKTEYSVCTNTWPEIDLLTCLVRFDIAVSTG